ncbi:MAG: family 20 glycosylhydrolase, partial [Terrimicrobiaceae bacterium]|nr:family 20 glycosylhydrolase [Terrimicrobiaceae bacterium]
GMQADPTSPAFQSTCSAMIRDVLADFDASVIHLGGDETWQLGHGTASAARVSAYESGEMEPPYLLEEGEQVDGKAALYAAHLLPLLQQVIQAGRVPALWGDMFYDHPQALRAIPPETILFDWQYFRSPEVTAERFRRAGFRTVLCPAIQTYSAAWCHLPQSERNIREAAEAAVRRDDYGVCVTTWECGLFGNYESLIPAIRASGRLVAQAMEETAPNSAEPIVGELPVGLGGEDAVEAYRQETDAPVMLHEYLRQGENVEEWARLMGCELQSAGDIFAYSGHRSQLKCRLLLYSNPFLLWLRHRDALLADAGNKAYDIASRAIHFAPDSGYRGVSEFVKLVIEFVRHADQAAKHYAEQNLGNCQTELAVTRQILDALERIAQANLARFGGSRADIERARIAREHVEKVMQRVKRYGDGSLGYRPSFESLTHPKFVPHDQANWWLINRWGNE